MTLSPDGKHQWDGTEWQPVPPPPKSRGERVHEAFQVAVICLVAVVVVLGLLGLFA